MIGYKIKVRDGIVHLDDVNISVRDGSKSVIIWGEFGEGDGNAFACKRLVKDNQFRICHADGQNVLVFVNFSDLDLFKFDGDIE